ncbi:MAG: BrnA antitoxin family protein [Deltaproteobacteria bacterium]|nr:BrnA antitoxin family protein [Deltaproteobacteria bacterium]
MPRRRRESVRAYSTGTQRGRPPKPHAERYRVVSIRLHPKVMRWAKEQAKRRHVGYQTVINAVLLEVAA